MMMRRLGWIALPATVFVASATSESTIVGQERSAPRLVITAFGGKAVDDKGAAHAVG